MVEITALRMQENPQPNRLQCAGSNEMFLEPVADGLKL